MSNWWKKKMELERAAKNREALGETNPLLRTREQHLLEQQLAVGHFVRQCFDGGFDSETLVQSLMVGAIWLADNLGISREALHEIIKRTELKTERQLIFKPGG